MGSVALPESEIRDQTWPLPESEIRDQIWPPVPREDTATAFKSG